MHVLLPVVMAIVPAPAHLVSEPVSSSTIVPEPASITLQPASVPVMLEHAPPTPIALGTVPEPLLFGFELEADDPPSLDDGVEELWGRYDACLDELTEQKLVREHAELADAPVVTLNA